MEIDRKNVENVNKEVSEDSKILENSSNTIESVKRSEKKCEIMIEEESKDSNETKDIGGKPKISETKELAFDSGSSFRSLETVKTCPSPSNESEKSAVRSETDPSREKSPVSSKTNSEVKKLVPEDLAASKSSEKVPEDSTITEDKEESRVVESAPENVSKISKSPIEIAKPESPKQAARPEEEISDRSTSPEVRTTGENAIIREEAEEEDLENGQDEEEEDEMNDDEIVEHEEESSGNLVDPPEVGIVGPPTAVRDIVNDEELGTTESSSLPSETKNNETEKRNNNRTPDVAEWIERSRLTNDAKEKSTVALGKPSRRRKKSPIDVGAPGGSRKSQKIVTSIIRRSIKCLNKMHAAAEYGSGGTSVKKLEPSEKREEDCRSSPKVPQSRQNGAALPEETATAMATSASHVNSERLRPIVKSENPSDDETEEQQSSTIDCQKSLRQRSIDEAPSDSRSSRKKSPLNSTRGLKTERESGRKRRSTDDSTNFGQQFTKKMCFEQRELFIDSLVGTSERVSAEELATRADKLRAEVQALDELARAKELEWNEILSMRKLKEEAYLRIERRRQVVGYMESNGQLSENLPPASLSLIPDWESSSGVGTTIGENSAKGTRSQELLGTGREGKESICEEVRLTEAQESQKTVESPREMSPTSMRREKTSGQVKTSNNAQRRAASPKQLGENGRKQQQRNQQQQQQQQQRQQQISEQQSLDNRQIGEGRQGPIVDVRSIIADYRLRHPETVPRRYDNSKKDSPARPRETTTTNTRTSGLINVRRGRRMRNSVNIGLGAGGAMVETTHHNVDSRPSSTDSCKSSNDRTNPDNSMSFKDVLVQFAKLSQQQGEPVKTPQNYPDVTLHPVAPTTVTINSTPTQQQTTGSLLHGILTKSQSPRPTTFSPTLARLLTAPERERTNLPTSITAVPQQNIQTQHLLQTYQGSSPVSISDLLSSSKARTEITITPVVTPMTPSHASQSNSLVHVDDVEEETSLMDERDSRLGSGARDNREERDSPPRCQGCQERAAQFVCAGCGNQWYCSRDCQVAAWDDHSEVCSG